MARKPKTIFGKIFKVVKKTVLPVAGAAVGLGAVTGVLKGVGAIKGIGGLLKGGKKVIDKVGASAAKLVTGQTKEEREQLQAVKDKVKAYQDKVDQYNRLVNAGASPDEARAMVGLSAAEQAAEQAADIAEKLEKAPGLQSAKLLGMATPDLKAQAAGCMVSFPVIIGGAVLLWVLSMIL